MNALSVHAKITIAPHFWTESKREVYIWQATGSNTLYYRMHTNSPEYGDLWLSVRSVDLGKYYHTPQAFVTSRYNYVVEYKSLI